MTVARRRARSLERFSRSMQVLSSRPSYDKCIMRGRVAITCQAGPLADQSIHIGHARTLVLGELICQHLDIPYHIRIDGVPDAVSHEMLIDLSNCIERLGVRHREMVWPTVPPDVSHMSTSFRALCHTRAGTPNLAQILFDMLEPMLVIRGMDFVDPVYYPDAAANMLTHVHFEDDLRAAAGIERNEVNTPIITMGHEKLSKSRVRIVHWSILRALPCDLARRFLVATAFHPHAPLEHLDDEFSMPIPRQPYEWSWDIWHDLIRRNT